MGNSMFVSPPLPTDIPLHWKGRKHLIIFNLVMMVVAIIMFCVCTSFGDKICTVIIDYYAYPSNPGETGIECKRANTKPIWLIMGLPLFPFMLLHLGLHAGILRQVDDRLCHDIGVSIAVLDGLAITPSFCYMIFGNYTNYEGDIYSLIPSFAIVTACFMAMVFIIGVIFGGLEVEHRRKRLASVRSFQAENPFPSPTLIAVASFPTNAEVPAYQIPVWLRKSDAEVGTEIRVEVLPDKYVFDVLEQALQKLPFDDGVKVGDLQLLTEQKQPLDNLTPVSILNPQQKFIVHQIPRKK